MIRQLCVVVALGWLGTAPPLYAVDYTWSNVAGGNWNVNTNWNPTGIPTSTDNATLNALANPYTVTVTTSQAITNLSINGNATWNLSSGTFTLGGTMTTGTGGVASWTGGTLTGNGTLAGTILSTGIGKEILGTTLQNQGLLRWQAGSIFSSGATQLTNASSGEIRFEADGDAFRLGSGFSPGTLVNQGTISKTGGTSSSTVVNWAVTNTGTVQVNTGTLVFGGGLTSNTGGLVRGPAGASGTYGGTLTFNSGSTLSPSNSGQAGGLNLSNGLTLSAGANLALRISGTTAITGFSQLNVTGVVTLNNATLTGDTTGFTPDGTPLFLILNDGTDAVVGTFAGVAQGGTLTIGGYTATISYTGNFVTQALTGGNDVVLSNFVPVPEPGTWLLLGLATVAVNQRLRRRVR
jgi:hypothetical protein